MVSANNGKTKTKRAKEARRIEQRFQCVLSRFADDEAENDDTCDESNVGEAPRGRRLEDQFFDMDAITDDGADALQQLQQLPHQQAAPAGDELATRAV